MGLFIANQLLYLLLTLIRLFGPRYAGPGTLRLSTIRALKLLGWIKAAMAVSFTYLAWSIIEIALGRATTLPPQG